jgi:hypothetical protein
MGIVESLEMPDDERREKEEFCRELAEIVQRLRPCTFPRLPCLHDCLVVVSGVNGADGSCKG